MFPRGNSPVKMSEMLVVSCSCVNLWFWSHLGCSRWNATIFSHQCTSVRVEINEMITKYYLSNERNCMYLLWIKRHYPTILTKQTWSIKDLLDNITNIILLVILSRQATSRQGSPVLHAHWGQSHCRIWYLLLDPTAENWYCYSWILCKYEWRAEVLNYREQQNFWTT